MLDFIIVSAVAGAICGISSLLLFIYIKNNSKE